MIQLSQDIWIRRSDLVIVANHGQPPSAALVNAKAATCHSMEDFASRIYRGNSPQLIQAIDAVEQRRRALKESSVPTPNSFVRLTVLAHHFNPQQCGSLDEYIFSLAQSGYRWIGVSDQNIPNPWNRSPTPEFIVAQLTTLRHINEEYFGTTQTQK